MNKVDLVSIIIPIYNTKEELPKCIESVMNQKYRNLEIILVDDGSTDGSAEICDFYAIKDERVKVIHKENGGNTSARKVGVQIAKGSYIGFVDSDDWIEVDMYDKLHSLAISKKADIVTSGCWIESNGSSLKRIDGVQAGIYNKDNGSYNRLMQNLIYVSGTWLTGIKFPLCFKLFRREIIIEALLGVSDNIQYSEDGLCVYSAILKSNRVYVSHECFYHYYIRSNSITHTKDEIFFSKINLWFLELKKIIEQYPEYKVSLLEQLGKHMVSLVCDGINHMFDFGIPVSMPYYICPLEKINKGARIILYGASDLGSTYYKQIKQNKNYNLIGWIDKNSAECREKGINVSSVDQIQKMDYDVILLDAKYKNTADCMIKYLQENGISKEKIFWEEPKRVMDTIIE